MTPFRLTVTSVEQARYQLLTWSDLSVTSRENYHLTPEVVFGILDQETDISLGYCLLGSEIFLKCSMKEVNASRHGLAHDPAALQQETHYGCRAPTDPRH